MTRADERRWPLFLVFFLTLLVYLLTRSPALTWAHRGADGGDFLAAAATLGVPHPAGYPTLTLLLRLFMLLPVSEPAGAGSLLSTVMGALAAALCAGIVQEVLARRTRGGEERSWVPWLATAGGLTFGFLPLVWSQALITEVYSFHLALIAAVIWFLMRWRRTGDGLPLVGLAAGLGMTNHLTTLFVAPAALAILVDGRRKLRWRSLLAAGGAFVVGLAPYAYLPWAARRTPPVNWENPQTWDNFQKLVFASRYRHNVLESTPSEVLARVTSWLTDFPPQYFWPLYLLILFGLAWLLTRDPAVGVMSGVYAVLVAGYAAGYGTSDYWVNTLPALMMAVIWLCVGFWLLLRWLGRHTYRSGRWRRFLLLAVVVVALAVPVGMVVAQWGEMDIRQDRAASDFVAGALEVAAPDALVFTKGDARTFAMWYACYVLDERPDLVPILPTFLRSRWYRESLQAHHEGLNLYSAGLGKGALETMISRHIGQRPIYLTWENEELAADYSLVQEGPLWQVLKLSAGDLP